MVIPADWKEIELSKIADIGPGINKALSEMGTGSLYVTVEDIYSGSSLDIGRLGRIRISRSEIERFSLQVGDLVLGKSSVKRDGIGYPNLFLGCAEPVVPSGFTYRVRPDKNVLNSKFLLQYLRSRPGRKWIIDNSQSSALTNINSAIVNRYPVTVPPLKEQEAIAGALSDADAAIESLDALIAKKRDVKQAAMQQLLTGRTRLPGFTADWEEKYLGDIARVKTGSRNNQDKVADGRYPFFVRSAHVESIDSYSYDTEAILIPGEGGIGEIFHYINGPHEVHQRVYRISDFSLDTCPKFIFFYLRSFFGAHAMRNTVKATVDSLRLPTFLEFELLIPTLKEQEAIAEALTVMDDELEALTEQVSKLRMVKEGMMQDLLTGKVRLV